MNRNCQLFRQNSTDSSVTEVTDLPSEKVTFSLFLVKIKSFTNKFHYLRYEAK